MQNPQNDEPTLLSFTASGEDYILIGKILERGMEMAKDAGVQIDHMTAVMDIATVHCNGTPLKLLQFLMSDASDFAHDFTGIGIHVDRSNGKLKNGFVPLFAAAKH